MHHPTAVPEAAVYTGVSVSRYGAKHAHGCPSAGAQDDLRCKPPATGRPVPM
ncbi:Unknown protein sequence [Pseudomonas coronafaciens pv. oryzae]|nr:Unknown protein sequence [Pseudomonas coronafaciens pv. oryzae]